MFKTNEMKNIARKMLMLHGQVAFNRLAEDHEFEDWEDYQKQKLHEIMSKEFIRMEKLFNYIPGSWARGV